jgi:hypothetical protein
VILRGDNLQAVYDTLDNALPAVGDVAFFLDPGESVDESGAFALILSFGDDEVMRVLWEDGQVGYSVWYPSDKILLRRR